ncbi:MAG: hypothetical protein HY097_05620 [Nitrospinae bacterium]|nr:hypothetical protein [Nitrospinota bacterium]MBI3814380.1 hypothetical protein [Nitrospinota bacterium]
MKQYTLPLIPHNFDELPKGLTDLKNSIGLYDYRVNADIIVGCFFFTLKEQRLEHE